MMKIKTMSFDDLVKARAAITQELIARSSAMRAQLARWDQAGTAKGPRLVTSRKKRTVSKKGAKIPPKYKDPETGATWAGRGVRPKWVKAAHLIKAA